MKRIIDLSNYKNFADVPEMQEIFEKCDVLCECIAIDKFNNERDKLRRALPTDPNPLLAVLSTNGKIEIMSRKCCKKKFGTLAWFEDFDRVTLAGEYGLPIIYRSADVVCIGENVYIVGSVVACCIDENGNEVSVNGLTLVTAYRYLKDYTVTLCIDGKDYKAFKL